jgi:hypothetical protein
MWDTLPNTSWILIFFVFQKCLSQNWHSAIYINQRAVKDKYVPKTFGLH